MARLQEKYFQKFCRGWPSSLAGENPHSLPRLKKIVVNMGVGQASQDRKRLEEATGHLATITGQKPLVTKAKKAISAFRLRQGMEIGCKVTCAGSECEFLDRLISLALPRVRDFRGLSPRAFDGNGNYTLGLSEQLVFPEIEADKVTHTQGMHISLVTSADTDDEARVLLKELGLPISVEKVKE